MTTKTAMEWLRAKRNSTGSRYWDSGCRRYKVTASEMCWGIKLTPVIYSAWFKGTIRDLDGLRTTWVRLSKHRSRAAAMRACEAHSRKRD